MCIRDSLCTADGCGYNLLFLHQCSHIVEAVYIVLTYVCQSEFEALVLEDSQIKAHTPKYNILLKDDKGYSYVKITHGPWPRMSAALQKDDENADYIGPFTSAFAVREMVETAQNCFLLPPANRFYQMISPMKTGE